MTFASDSYDVIVVGGGPAGSTSATLIAQQGHSVLLLEREKLPIHKVGESLMPASWSVLERLGVLDKLSESHFPKKYSVQFFSNSGRGSSPFYFSESPCVDHPQTWQVVRSEFDHLLFENAREKGVEAHDGVNVREILFSGDRATGVRVKGPDGEMHQLSSRVVVDASGQSSLISSKFKLKQEDPKLRNASMFTYFEGGQRGEDLDEGATLILHTEDKDSWFWYIPQPNDRVSVGVVAPFEYLVRPPKRPPQQVFEEELAKCPGLQPRLVGATQVGPMQVLKDFTYRSRRRAGEGWVLVGDAYGFVDPLYSSGVYFALKSGELAADAIVGGFAANDLSGERLGSFEPLFLRGMEAVRKLVHAFYDKDFSISKFLRKHPEHRDDLVQILVGNVFRDGVDDLFGPMGSMTDLPESWVVETPPL